MRHTNLEYQDLIKLDREGKYLEIIGGILYNHPTPSPEHQDILGKLYRVIVDYVEREAYGKVFFAPFDIILSKEDVMQPDLVFFRDVSHLTERGYEGVPDLVVEIISHYTKAYDNEKKKALYATYGIPYFWLIDPDEGKLEIFKFTGKGYELESVYVKGQEFESPLFPGLNINLRYVFGGL